MVVWPAARLAASNAASGSISPRPPEISDSLARAAGSGVSGRYSSGNDALARVASDRRGPCASLTATPTP